MKDQQSLYIMFDFYFLTFQICDSIPGIVITCNESEVLYRIEKNDIFTWTYEIRSQVNQEY